MITIGLVDNDPYALKVLSGMMTRMDGDFHVLWTTTSGAVAVSRCVSVARRPNVLVSDMSMGDISGAQVCRAIRAKTPDVGLVGVTSYVPAAFCGEAARCGAQALVSKTDISGMGEAIRRAARGIPTPCAADESVAFMDSRTAYETLENESYAAGGGVLSAKERETLRLYAEGRNTREIAETLGVAVPTVATFERRALAKLEARSRAHAISICVRRHEF